MNQKILSSGAEAKIILVEQHLKFKSPMKKSADDKLIIKSRIKKSYRIPELDDKIRKLRTRAEVKLLEKSSELINVPMPEKNKDKNSTQIKMPFIDGKKLSESLDKFSLKKQKQILNQIGKDIAKLHNENIIHGDLTTSNMILVENETEKIKKCYSHKNPPQNNFSLTKSQRSDLAEPVAKQSIASDSKPIIFFIDFGLGYFNGKYEDKAVDIHLLKQALEAKHFKNWKILFKEFENGYKSVDKLQAEKVLNQLVKVEKRGRYKN